MHLGTVIPRMPDINGEGWVPKIIKSGVENYLDCSIAHKLNMARLAFPNSLYPSPIYCAVSNYDIFLI